MTESTMMTIGCDLGDRTSHLCVLSPEGDVLKRAKVASTTRAFETFFSGLEPARIVLEVGTHSRWSSALLMELGHRCIVASGTASPTPSSDASACDGSSEAAKPPRNAPSLLSLESLRSSCIGCG